jgi:hypothetical protein
MSQAPFGPVVTSARTLCAHGQGCKRTRDPDFTLFFTRSQTHMGNMRVLSNSVLTVLAVLATIWTVPAALSDDFAGLPRPVQNENRPDWQAVGRVNLSGFKSRSYCSGTLVAPDIVLTAAHCLFDQVNGPLITPNRVTFGIAERLSKLRSERPFPYIPITIAALERHLNKSLSIWHWSS